MRWGLESGTVTFGSETALDNVTISVDPGSVVVVVGGDGAGKSTALRALVGLLRLSAGQVRRPGKQCTGYIPATAGLYVDLTVEENLDFAARVYGLKGEDYRARSASLLEQIGLCDARARLGGQLSGGMQRKLALAMALIHRPKLLVLDEPTTGVDPVSRAEMWRLISGEVAQGAAVIVATTYVDEANRGAMVILLGHGQVITAGSPADIIAAVPGALGVVRERDRPPGQSWRRGTSWRVWSPTGVLPGHAEPVRPSFNDAVMIAALSEQQEL